MHKATTAYHESSEYINIKITLKSLLYNSSCLSNTGMFKIKLVSEPDYRYLQL